MTQRCVMLSASTYDMTKESKDSDGNVKVTGTKGLSTWYYPLDSMVDTTNPRTDNGISKGTAPMQVTFLHDSALKLGEVPGVYDFKVQMQAVARKSDYEGQRTQKMIQTIVPVDFTYVGPVQINAEPKAVNK